MPNLGVNVAVIRDEQVLLTKREDFEVWCLPGGEVDTGESVAQAAIREAREETGLVVRLSCLVGVYSRLGFPGDSHALLFKAEAIGGRPRLQPGETMELGWFRADGIPRETMEWHRQRIADALAGVGCGVAWLQNTRSSLAGQAMTRQTLYDLRDQSGLSRQEFYFRTIEPLQPGDEILELKGAQSP